jgi:NAD(P)-dependent dehydrogenase (short-subunit alcohol dehydrogenase family)
MSRRGKAYWGAYAVSKFGVEGLMQVLAAEMEGTTNVRSNSVNPGPVRTFMRLQAYPAEDRSQLREASAVVAPFLFLLGPESRGINGQAFDAQ